MQNDHDTVRGFPYIQFDAFISSASGFGHGCHAVFRDDELFGHVPAPAASMGKHVYASLLSHGNCCGHCKQNDYSKNPLHAVNLQKIFILAPSPYYPTLFFLLCPWKVVFSWTSLLGTLLCPWNWAFSWITFF